MDIGVTGPAIFGIVCALVIMWLSLKRYEGFFDDRMMFKSLILGFITGFLAFLTEAYGYNAGIIFLFIFPFMEQFLKLVGINLPSYHDKRETIIYGLVLGLGFGSIYMPLLIILASRGSNPSFSLQIGSLALGVGYILFHGGTGCMLGYGVFKSEKWRYLFYATFLGFPLPLIEMGTFYLNNIIAVATARVVESLYGLVVFLIVYKRILPHALPRRKRRELL